MTTALITGITGQDGSYLAEFLLARGYTVYGFGRKHSIQACRYLHPLRTQLEFCYGDINDFSSIYAALQEAQPDEIYNLASQSHPGESWKISVETGDITGLGAHRLMEVARQLLPKVKIYQASSSEMFGNAVEVPQSEHTPFNPLSPYAAAKVYAHQIACVYRNTYGMFISNGILFNHESVRRGSHFITQKVSYGAACAKLGITDSAGLNEQGNPVVSGGKLILGDLSVSRDWGYAPDYVAAMWLMLQQERSDDFVIGTGVSRTIRELCDVAYRYAGLAWQEHVVSDASFLRPVETRSTVACANKAIAQLGWQPTTRFEDMIAEMVDCHVQELQE